MRVVVVGGGITGLVAAWELAALEGGPQVVLLESGPRLGGKLRTRHLAGEAVEGGADSFLARLPRAAELCREVGLGERLISPATGEAAIWTSRGLRALPRGLVLGVPTSLVGLARSGLVSRRGAARSGLDLLAPRTAWGEDPSVAEVVGGRLGQEVLRGVVEPLLGGIHASTADRLSLAAVAPPVAEAAAGSRSLVLGLRRQRREASGSGAGPVFWSLAGGLGQLVERLGDRIRRAGGEIRLGAEVRSLSMDRAAEGLRVEIGGAPTLLADAAVLATPAHTGARLLGGSCAPAAGELAAIGHASVAMALLAYAPSALLGPLAGSGFLVPRNAGRLMTACSFASTKWPSPARSGLAILRCSSGHIDDSTPSALDDDELIARVHSELSAAIGATAPPVEARVERWIDAFPQYEPGHRARVDRAEAALAAALPGVVLAGAPYHGIGVASCIEDAHRAAGRVRLHLAGRTETA
ncbi:MAG: protoporphyrinogen oxidase [Acidimicrobiales bacterium]